LAGTLAELHENKIVMVEIDFRRKIRAKMDIYGPWGFWTICSLFPTADLQ
jgi:hypothetical protein